MLMLKNNALKLGLLATAVFGITIASCKKDDDKPVLRSKEYLLKDLSGAGSGKVSVQEVTDSTFNLTIRLEKSTKDTVYTFALYKGNTTATAFDTAFSLGTIKSQTTGAALEAKLTNVKTIKVSDTQTQKFNYDSLLKYNAFARVTFKDLKTPPKDSVVAIGNVGKSAQ